MFYIRKQKKTRVFKKMKIVVASDSFKGSLTNEEINDIWLKTAEKDDDTEIVPLLIADGGDGTLDSIIKQKNGEFVFVRVRDPLFNEIQARYGVFDDCAVISMCEASGLTLVDEKRRNPMKTTSYGTGELIKDAVLSGKKKIYITLGGSAVNDCGIGALSALGYKFIKADGSICSGVGGELSDIKNIDSSDAVNTKGVEFIILSDVTNRLCGKAGAAYTFARQKGANENDIEFLEKGAMNFSEVLFAKYGVDANEIIGGGAAGGMGAGLAAVLGAKIISGIETVLDLVGFDEKIYTADYVITGEGRIDSQSKDGKLISGVIKRSKKLGVPVIAVAGSVGNGIDEMYSQGLTAVFSIVNEPMSLDDAMARSKALYEKTARNVYNLIKARV